MPLSEHEQRQLEQIEQALYAEHPRFARAVRATDPKVHYRRRVFQAAAGAVVGVGLLVSGVILKDLWMAAAGGVVILACATWALASYRHMAGIAAGRGMAKDRRVARPQRGAGARRASRPPSTGMMDRLEERWRRRQERGR